VDHLDIRQKAQTTGDILDEVRTALKSGIAIVTPAHKIKELLMREDVVEDREHALNELRAATFDSAGDDALSSLAGTADLMTNLLQVPKEEADEVHRGHGE
jgi:hypothetical protein